MKVYEVKRNGYTLLLAYETEPKENDIVVRELDVEMPNPNNDIVEIEDGDYVLHYENGEFILKKLEEV